MYIKTLPMSRSTMSLFTWCSWLGGSIFGEVLRAVLSTLRCAIDCLSDPFEIEKLSKK